MLGFAIFAKPMWICSGFRMLVASIKFKPSDCPPIHSPEFTMFTPVPEPTALARLHDQARREARRLRREAIDNFWRGADAVWQRSLAGGQALTKRSANRLKARLAHRANHSANTTTTKA